MQLLTHASENRFHQRAVQAAQKVTDMVVNSESIEASSPGDVVVRDILPDQDFESGDDNGYTTSGDAEWRQDWSGGTADAWNEAYEIDSSANADNKIVLFYGLQFGDSDVVTRSLRFLKGTGGTQGVKAWVNCEEMEPDTEASGLLAQDVVYGAAANGSVEHWIEDAVDGQRFRYLGVIGEAVGGVLSEPTNPRVAGR